MSRNYSITEPHPSVPATNIFHSGRGGAGNVTYVNPKSVTPAADAKGPASRAKLTTPSSNVYFPAGRGGAGNMHREKERAIFSFDEELDRQRKLMEHSAPVYHVGRGGAGNLIDEMGEKRRTSHSSGDSASSSGSVRHSMEAGINKIRGSFARH